MKNDLNDFFLWIVNSLMGGLICLITGVALIMWSVYKPTEKAQIRGWAAGIGFVICGMIIIVMIIL